MSLGKSVVITVIVLLIIFVLVVLCIGIFTKTTINGNPNPVETLGLDCSKITCDSSTICDPSTLRCVYPTGHSCDSYSQCPSGNFCSGVCVKGEYGQFQQYCPCGRGLKCKIEKSSLCSSDLPCGICLKDDFATCQNNSECYTGWCKGQNGGCTPGESNCFCAPGKLNGQSCNIDSDCASGNCSTANGLSFCQPQGIVTGQYSSICGFTPNTATCNSNFTCIDNTCQISSQGLSQICNNNIGQGNYCTSNYQCTDGICTFPTDFTVSICRTTSCIGGYSCGNNHICLGNSGTVVARSDFCLSSRCTNGGLNSLGIISNGVNLVYDNIYGNSNLGYKNILSLPSSYRVQNILLLNNVLYLIANNTLYKISIDSQSINFIRNNIQTGGSNIDAKGLLLFIDSSNGQIISYDGVKFSSIGIPMNNGVSLLGEKISFTNNGTILIVSNGQGYLNSGNWDMNFTVSSFLDNILDARFYSQQKQDIVYSRNTGLYFSGQYDGLNYPGFIINFDVLIANKILEIWIISRKEDGIFLRYTQPPNKELVIGGSMGFQNIISNRILYSPCQCQ